MKYFLIALTLIASGCAAIKNNELSMVEQENIISLAHKSAISNCELTSKEIELILSKTPRVNYYFTSSDYAQYSIHWQFNESKRSIVISGHGNIHKLENSDVTCN